MNLSALLGEEKLLLAKLDDLYCNACEIGRDRFSAFLNEREVDIAIEMVRQYKFENCYLYGGFDDAQRRIFGAFALENGSCKKSFPIKAIAVNLPKDAKITHRDVLGSLMSLGVKRECIGDILISDAKCDVFVQDSVAPYILQELKKIGGYGVRCSIETGVDFFRNDQFQHLRTTLKSARMDALVSDLANLAREKGAMLIKSERVRRNHQLCKNGADPFFVGDIVTIRGYGRYVVDEIGNPTKKGRLPVICRKYI